MSQCLKVGLMAVRHHEAKVSIAIRPKHKHHF